MLCSKPEEQWTKFIGSFILFDMCIHVHLIKINAVNLEFLPKKELASKWKLLTKIHYIWLHLDNSAIIKGLGRGTPMVTVDF